MPNTSPNMGLIVPIPSTGVTGTGDTGPGYAVDISNDLLNTIDAHNHAPGNGVPIPPAGLNINTDLTIQSNNLTNIRASRFTSQATSLSGVGDVSEIYVVNGDLWYNNRNGVAVQITSGSGAVNSLIDLPYQAATTNWTIMSSDTYVWLGVVLSNAAATVTLPAAGSVKQGRWYVISDVLNLANTYNITINAVGTDTISGYPSLQIQSNGGTVIIGSSYNPNSGISSWQLISQYPSPNAATYFQAGVTGLTGSLVGPQNQAMVSWGNVIQKSGNLSQATLSGTGAASVNVGVGGIFEISYNLVGTGPAASDVFQAEQRLNATGIGIGTAIPQSLSYGPGAGGNVFAIATKSYIVSIASGSTIQTWITGFDNQASGVYLSQTGTNFVMRKIG